MSDVLFQLPICYLSIRLVISAWLKGSAQSTVGKLDQKISMLTGLNVKHPYGEYLQVVNYGIGGHYEPHFDHATVSWLYDFFLTRSKNKLSTLHVVCASINDDISTFSLSSHLQVPCSSWKLGIEWQPLWYMWVKAHHLMTLYDPDSSQSFLGRFLFLLFQSLNWELSGQAFATSATRLWNNLPQKLRLNMTSLPKWHQTLFFCLWPPWHSLLLII